MPAITIAIANQKGGVGKTTTTVNLGDALARMGIPTLIVDLDPQANATSSLGFEKKAGEGIYDPLLAGGDLSDRMIAARKNLWLVPSELDLAAAELELSSQKNYLGNLKKCLANLKKGNKVKAILIDCPPTLGILSMNSLTAADQLLVTLQTEYLALEGLSQIIGVIDQLKKSGVNKDIALGGIVMTMYDGRTKLSQEVHNEVKSHYSNKLFATQIPRNIRLSECPSFGQTIFEYDDKSPGAKAYLRLADEVTERFFSQPKKSKK